MTQINVNQIKLQGLDVNNVSHLQPSQLSQVHHHQNAPNLNVNIAHPTALNPSQPKRKSAQRKRSAGRKTGARGYSPPELQVLFSLIRRIKPTGRDGWTKVSISYNAIASDQGLAQREPDSLRKKFQKLVNHNKTAFDPNCPWEVKQAKQVQRELANFALGYDFGIGGNPLKVPGPVPVPRPGPPRPPPGPPGPPPGPGGQDHNLFGFMEGDILAALEDVGNRNPSVPSISARGHKRHFSSILKEAQHYLGNNRHQFPHNPVDNILEQVPKKPKKSDDSSVLLAMLINQQSQFAQQQQQQQQNFMHMMQQQHQQVVSMMMMLANSNFNDALNNLGGSMNFGDMSGHMNRDHAALRPVLTGIGDHGLGQVGSRIGGNKDTHASDSSAKS